MTRQDRLAPGLLLLFFGASPWVVSGVVILLEERDLLTPQTVTTGALVLGVAAALGTVAVLVALALGIVLWWRGRGAGAPDSAPRKPASDSRPATAVARAAAAIAAIVLWGPFGALFIGPTLAGERVPELREFVPFVFALSLTSTLAGVIMLARSRRQRSK